MNENNLNDLPLLDFIFDEEVGNIAKIISMVTHPAIKQDGMAFNQDFDFKVENEEKRLFTGPILRPDVPIYRNINGFEFMGRFSVEEVEKFRYALFRDGNHNKTRINHDGGEIDSGVVMIESWSVDNPEMDKSNHLGFKNVGTGDWYGTYKVNNDEVWSKIKSGEIRGFSIEGSFGIVETALSMNLDKMIRDIYNSNDSDITKISKINKLLR